MWLPKNVLEAHRLARGQSISLSVNSHCLMPLSLPQHVKDMLQIRKNDLDSYRRATKRAPKDPFQSTSTASSAPSSFRGTRLSSALVNGGARPGDATSSGLSASPPCPLTRDRAVPVVKLLFSLLSRLDASCSSDTFLRTCKLIGHIMRTCRPTLSLSEAVQEETVVSLLHRFASASLVSSLGESWAGPYGLHAVACLFSDLLDAEEECGANAAAAAATLQPPPPPLPPPSGPTACSTDPEMNSAPIALQEEPGTSPDESLDHMSEPHSPPSGAQVAEMDFLKRESSAREGCVDDFVSRILRCFASRDRPV